MFLRVDKPYPDFDPGEFGEAESAGERAVGLGFLGPVGLWATELRLRHLASVLGLMP